MHDDGYSTMGHPKVPVQGPESPFLMAWGPLVPHRRESRDGRSVEKRWPRLPTKNRSCDAGDEFEDVANVEQAAVQ